MSDPLTTHFTLDEFLISQTAAREGINNIPDNKSLQNLQKLAELLEKVRTALGNNALVISSGYRSPELNKRIGGAADSAHMYGLAADFTAPHYGSPFNVALAISQLKDTLDYDQLIYEYGSWVHIGLPRSGGLARKQDLTVFKGKHDQNGIHAS